MRTDLNSNRSEAGNFLLFVTLLCSLALLYCDDVRRMLESWRAPEYSHGVLIPFIALALVWQRLPEILRVSARPSWWGILILLVAIGLYLAGNLSTIYLVVHFSLILAIGGLVVSLAGWEVARIVWPAWLYLFFMIPMPQFLELRLSLSLQLLSSEIGVSLMRVFGVSVFLQGNVIDLGVYQLQVAEACSGLRYLFPLLSFGFLISYLYKGRFWERALLISSILPITVLINSARISAIGVLVDKFGIGAAEGFVHWFEGWVAFMVCLAVLFLEARVLTKLSSKRLATLDLSFPSLAALRKLRPRAPLPSGIFGTCLALLLTTAVAAPVVENRDDRVPMVRSFVTFPLTIDEWRGQDVLLEQVYVDALQLDDYVLANYESGVEREPPVNLYVAWYASQRKGSSAHSPRSCLPGDGWEIAEFAEVNIPGIAASSYPFQVNRAVIQKGSERQLVYYWFDQRGRLLTSEYLVKWYILWDGLTRQRTDGALIRLTTPVPNGTRLDEADRRLTEFLRLSRRHLANYIPS